MTVFVGLGVSFRTRAGRGLIFRRGLARVVVPALVCAVILVISITADKDTQPRHGSHLLP